MGFDRMRLAWCFVLLTMTCGCDYRAPTAPTAVFTPVMAAPTPPTPPAATPRPIPATTLAVGEVVRASIGFDDPVCDPQGWDSGAACKRFVITPLTTGTLNVTLTATLPSPRTGLIDLMLYRGPYYEGDLLQYSDEGAANQVSAPVVGGTMYEIRINSYPYLLLPPGLLEFELRTEMSGRSPPNIGASHQHPNVSGAHSGV